MPVDLTDREIDADFVTVINVDYDIGHGWGMIGCEHRALARIRTFLGGTKDGVVFTRKICDCQSRNNSGRSSLRSAGYRGRLPFTEARSLSTPTARPGTSATKSAPTTNGSARYHETVLRNPLSKLSCGCQLNSRRILAISIA